MSMISGGMNFGGPSKPVTPYSPQQALGAVKTGYNNALANAQNALTASNNTTSGELGELSQNLGQQQSNIAQNLTNRGLGNTTVSATAQQAPMQNYNNAVANVMNQGAIRTMGADQNLAQLNAQSGQAQAGIMNPYAQTGYANQLQQYGQQVNQTNANMQAYQQSLMNAQNSMNAPGMSAGSTQSGPGNVFYQPQQPAMQSGSMPIGTNYGGVDTSDDDNS